MVKPPQRSNTGQWEQDDVDLYQRLTRDVCFLYHELSEYRHIMGDLDYANDYPLEYWTLLNRIASGRNDGRFIRSGILVLIMAMLQDAFDGSGKYIYRHKITIAQELERFVPEDDTMLRLAESVQHGMELLANSLSADDRFNTDACWVYDAFVMRYFINRAN